MLTVRHSGGSYKVVPTDVKSVLASLGSEDFVISDTNLIEHYELPESSFIVPAGERSKSLAQFAEATSWLATRARRSARVVAFGGGVVGDLAGFVAATFMRGVKLLQVPTSLLAMVDSSVGGKVGIDLPEGKNLVGAFCPPSRVDVPLDALLTLPLRQFYNGCAEIVKYAAIMDLSLLERLESTGLAPDSPNLQEVIFRCIDLKRQIVEQDEFEKYGQRATLNFGHTVGHALETALAYQGVLHGEAISIGMVIETRLAERLGVAKDVSQRLAAVLQTFGLPTSLPNDLDIDQVLSIMRRDKKASGNGVACSLVSEIGACKLHTGIAESDIRAVLENA